MLGRTSEYALRAMICLGRHSGEEPLTGQRIAEETGVPKKYLSKILSDLTRAGVLAGVRGKTGGFTLNRSAGDIRLMDVVSLFERMDETRCPFGNTECSNRNPCGAHHRWIIVKEAQRVFLEDTSIFEIAQSGSNAKRSRTTRARASTSSRKTAGH